MSAAPRRGTGGQRDFAPALRRRLSRVMRLLDQSLSGLRLAASFAGDEEFARFCAEKAKVRRAWAEELEAVGGSMRPSIFIRLMGRLHRTWIRVIGSSADAALADEIDRGEARLERQVRRTLRTGPAAADPRLHDLLVELRTSIVTTRDEILRRRATLDWGVERLPRIGGGRSDRDSKRFEVQSGGSSRKPSGWRLPRVSLVGEGEERESLEDVRAGGPLVVTLVEGNGDDTEQRLAELDAALPAFDDRDTGVLVIVRTDAAGLQRLTDGRDYTIRVLADPEGRVAEAVDAIDRSGTPLDGTLLIDRAGELMFVSVHPEDDTDAGEILGVVDRYRSWFPDRMKARRR